MLNEWFMFFEMQKSRVYLGYHLQQCGWTKKQTSHASFPLGKYYITIYYVECSNGLLRNDLITAACTKVLQVRY